MSQHVSVSWFSHLPDGTMAPHLRAVSRDRGSDLGVIPLPSSCIAVATVSINPLWFQPLRRREGK